MLFFLASCYAQGFFYIPVVREKIIVKPALAIPTGAPATLADEMLQNALLVALKAIKMVKR